MAVNKIHPLPGYYLADWEKGRPEFIYSTHYKKLTTARVAAYKETKYGKTFVVRPIGYVENNQTIVTHYLPLGYAVRVKDKVLWILYYSVGKHDGLDKWVLNKDGTLGKKLGRV